jgi:hypothetical protein
MSTAPQPVAGELRTLLPAGSTLYTVVTHESRSGDSCRILVLAPEHGRIVNYTDQAAAALGLRAAHDEMFVTRPREQAGEQVVKDLGTKLHGDTRAFQHVILA